MSAWELAPAVGLTIPGFARGVAYTLTCDHLALAVYRSARIEGAWELVDCSTFRVLAVSLSLHSVLGSGDACDWGAHAALHIEGCHE